MDTFTHKLLSALELNSSQIKELYQLRKQFNNNHIGGLEL